MVDLCIAYDYSSGSNMTVYSFIHLCLSYYAPAGRPTLGLWRLSKWSLKGRYFFVRSHQFVQHDEIATSTGLPWISSIISISSVVDASISSAMSPDWK